MAAPHGPGRVAMACCSSISSQISLMELMRLEDIVISHEQMKIIKLALEGLGIEQNDRLCYYYDGGIDGNHCSFYLSSKISPKTFSELYDRLVVEVGYKDTLLILYEALVGVGVEEEKLLSIRNYCDNKLSDSMYIHEKYPDFSTLLAIGNMVLSMSDEEYSSLCWKLRLAYCSRFDSVALIYRSKAYQSDGGFCRYLDGILNDCPRTKEYVDIYFDKLKVKKMVVKRIKSAKTILQGAMAKGY
uniref:Uncharacterized protein n=1 Tax=Amphimedon queenslandica TaxID=400682 RepID=A0A1X7SMC0_AMPQE